MKNSFDVVSKVTMLPEGSNDGLVEVISFWGSSRVSRTDPETGYHEMIL